MTLALSAYRLLTAVPFTLLPRPRLSRRTYVTRLLCQPAVSAERTASLSASFSAAVTVRPRAPPQPPRRRATPRAKRAKDRLLRVPRAARGRRAPGAPAPATAWSAFASPRRRPARVLYPAHLALPLRRRVSRRPMGGRGKARTGKRRHSAQPQPPVNMGSAGTREGVYSSSADVRRQGLTTASVALCLFLHDCRSTGFANSSLLLPSSRGVYGVYCRGSRIQSTTRSGTLLTRVVVDDKRANLRFITRSTSTQSEKPCYFKN